MLWHYTCAHGNAGLLADPYLRPACQRGFDAPQWWATVVWLTDLGILTDPDTVGLGLHPWSILSCDRTAFRWTAPDESGVVPWLDWLRAHPDTVPRDDMLALHYPPALPGRWYVAEVPVPVTQP